MPRESEKICNITDTTVAQELSKNALASCSRCGAMSNDPSSLCDPVSYPVDGVLGD